jgi:hypothetical protein
MNPEEYTGDANIASHLAEVLGLRGIPAFLHSAGDSPSKKCCNRLRAQSMRSFEGLFKESLDLHNHHCAGQGLGVRMAIMRGGEVVANL